MTVIDARSGTGRKVIPASTTARDFLLLPFSAPSRADDGSFPLKIETDVKSVEVAERPEIRGVQAYVHPRLKRVEKEILRRARDRAIVEQAASAHRNDPEAFRRFYASRPSKLSPRLSLSPTLAIHSPFDGEEETPITGILRASSAQTAIYVDSRVNDSVTTEEVENLRASFDDISLPRLHAFFGKESDIDGNGVIIFFLADPSKIGEDVLGFFRPSDLLPDLTVGGVRSNQMEVMYVRKPGPDFDFALGQATLAHEAFHLINFAVKSLPSFQQTGGFAGSLEELFLNEGQAHAAEDLLGWGIDTPLIADLYLDCFDQTSLGGGGTPGASAPCAITGDGNDSLARRGGMTLFLLYLFHQLGGARYSEKAAGDVTGDGVDFFRRLTESASNGIENLEEASGGRSFFSWYADFAAALALDNTGTVTDPRYAFAPEVTDSFTGFLRNIRTHSVRNDGTETITLTGPHLSQTGTAGSGLTIQRSLLVTGADAIRLTIPADTETVIRITGDRALSLGMSIVPLL